LKLINFD